MMDARLEPAADRRTGALWPRRLGTLSVFLANGLGIGAWAEAAHVLVSRCLQSGWGGWPVGACAYSILAPADAGYSWGASPGGRQSISKGVTRRAGRGSKGVTLMAATDRYVLGHSGAELKRLATQARLIDPITRRFLVSAGIRDGMRVLDVGSGVGDVAILLAGLVGQSGEVVGADIAQTAIDAAERRVRASSLEVTFRRGDPAAMAFDAPFDAVVGRYVLQFIPDPSAAIARLSSHLRPGGVVFFHELDWDGARSSPWVPTYDRVCGWIMRTIEEGGAHILLFFVLL